MSQKPSEQAGILVLGKMLASLSEGLVLLIIVRLLGKHDVGILASILVIYQTTVLIGSAGFPAAIMYFLPTRPAEERRAIAWKFAQTMMLLGIGAGLILAIIGLVSWMTQSGGNGEGISLQYLLVLSILPFADLPARMMPNLLIVEQRAKAAAGIGIVYSLGRTIATVLPLALGAGI